MSVFFFERKSYFITIRVKQQKSHFKNQMSKANYFTNYPSPISVEETKKKPFEDMWIALNNINLNYDIMQSNMIYEQNDVIIC